MMKKIMIYSLLGLSLTGVLPVTASAAWKQDKYNNICWIEKGVKATGWKNINGEWYYFREDGAMISQWLRDNGNWYYFWTNGTMASNSWIKNNGMWYYFDKDGKMVTDSVIIGNRKYDFTQIRLIFSKYITNNDEYITNEEAKKIIDKDVN